jgi:hypothetical protein
VVGPLSEWRRSERRAGRDEGSLKHSEMRRRSIAAEARVFVRQRELGRGDAIGAEVRFAVPSD